MLLRLQTNSAKRRAGVCRGGAREDFEPPDPVAIKRANNMLDQLFERMWQTVQSPRAGPHTEPQPAAEADVPPEDDAADIDGVAEQFLYRAAVWILGSAEPQPAPAPPQPEPAASQAHVPQQGGRHSGPPLTDEESAPSVAHGFDIEHLPWWDERSEADIDSAAADNAESGGSAQTAGVIPAAAPLDLSGDSSSADGKGQHSSLEHSPEGLSPGHTQTEAGLLPNGIMLLGPQQQCEAEASAAPVPSSLGHPPVGDTEASALPPSVDAHTAPRLAQPAELARPLETAQAVSGKGRPAHGVGAWGLAQEAGARGVVLECLLLLFVVRHILHPMLIT